MAAGRPWLAGAAALPSLLISSSRQQLVRLGQRQADRKAVASGPAQQLGHMRYGPAARNATALSAPSLTCALCCRRGALAWQLPLAWHVAMQALHVAVAAWRLTPVVCRAGGALRGTPDKLQDLALLLDW